MMLRLFLFSFLLVLTSQVSAQLSSHKWYPAQVQLRDNTVLEGELKYSMDVDAIQLQIGDRLETYTANQVISFTIQTDNGKRKSRRQVFTRSFYSLPYTNAQGYQRNLFFEVLVGGKATLLARWYMQSVNYPDDVINSGPALELQYQMYLGSLDGTITELTGKQRDVLQELKSHKKQLKGYIYAENLNVRRLDDMSRLFTYYNSLGE